MFFAKVSGLQISSANRKSANLQNNWLDLRTFRKYDILRICDLRFLAIHPSFLAAYPSFPAAQSFLKAAHPSYLFEIILFVP